MSERLNETTGSGDSARDIPGSGSTVGRAVWSKSCSVEHDLLQIICGRRSMVAWAGQAGVSRTALYGALGGRRSTHRILGELARARGWDVLVFMGALYGLEMARREHAAGEHGDERACAAKALYCRTGSSWWAEPGVGAEDGVAGQSLAEDQPEPEPAGEQER